MSVVIGKPGPNAVFQPLKGKKLRKGNQPGEKTQ
tara:strand:- start:2686 stop:2787 length:102 start_codon:yes stop_codon:yes gene_type:complete